VLSHVVGERSQKSADRLFKKTAQCLKALPLFVTDELKFYKIALLKQYGKLQSFIRMCLAPSTCSLDVGFFDNGTTANNFAQIQNQYLLPM
jgi:hypothetical protein